MISNGSIREIAEEENGKPRHPLRSARVRTEMTADCSAAHQNKDALPSTPADRWPASLAPDLVLGAYDNGSIRASSCAKSEQCKSRTLVDRASSCADLVNAAFVTTADRLVR